MGVGSSCYLFVHKPLYPPEAFQWPDAYVVKTDWYDVEWGNRLCKQEAIDGDFDDDLRGLRDIETLKRLLSEEKETEIVARCEQVGLKSPRVFAVEYLGDIKVQRWQKSQENKVFKSIRCDWSMEMGVSFWLTSMNDEKRSYWPRRTSVQECVETIMTNSTERLWRANRRAEGPAMSHLKVGEGYLHDV